MEKIESIIEGFVEKHNTVETKQYNIPGFICPYFTPKEKLELEGYYDNAPLEEEHKMYIDAITSVDPKDRTLWQAALESKLFELDKTNSDAVREAILAMGWNPEIPYNPNTQRKAKQRFISLMNESSSIHIESVIESELDILNEAKTEKLYPIHIVTVRGSAPISKVITTITSGDFSHAAISLDENVKKLYSFNMNNKVNVLGGFSIEDIEEYPKENRLAVYTFFVTKEAYENISNAIENFNKNIKKTSYSIITLITFPFKSIAIQDDDEQICSQFVDSLLKLGNLDISKEKSSKVDPNKLYSLVSTNSKAYKIFDGIVKDFDNNTAARIVRKLASKVPAANISESVVLEKQLPIEFNDRGDLLLTNPNPDYYTEYLNSHKLLKQYKQSHNIEGIKYELCKLYYMNYMIEKQLYHNKMLDYKNKNIKTRAKILNDFNSYMNYVGSQEPNFNFSEYYESSPYYHNTIEIKSSTIGKIKDIITFLV